MMRNTKNKKASAIIWISFGIVAVILLAGIYLILFNKKTVTNPENEANNNQNAAYPLETDWCTPGAIVENLNFSELTGTPVTVIKKISSKTNPMCHVKTDEEREYYVSIDMKKLFKVDYVDGQKKIS